MQRKLSRTALVVFVAVLAAVNNGCSGRDRTESEAETVSFDINEPKLKERLGVDDGYALALLYGADIHGSLETCG